MKTIKTFRIAAMLMAYLLLSILLASTPVTAGMIIYTYTGNSFNSFSNTTNPPYTKITGSFAVSSPLANNLVYSDIRSNITTWAFEDNVNNFSKDLGASINSCFVSTSSTGNIVAWHILLFSYLGNESYAELESYVEPYGARDMSSFNNPLTDDRGYAMVDDNKGTWSINERMPGSSSVAEPATMFLLSTGLIGLLGVRRKMRK